MREDQLSHAFLIVCSQFGDVFAVLCDDAAFGNGAEAVFVVIAHNVGHDDAKQIDEYGIVAASCQFAVECEVFFDSRFRVGAFFQFA